MLFYSNFKPQLRSNSYIMLLNQWKSWMLVQMCIMLSLMLPAQGNGNISGIITDKNDQKPLPGISVLLNPGDKGEVTSETGAFRFSGIEAGSYSLTVTSVGYKTLTITNMVITSGNENTLTIELEPEPKDLAAVTVRE